MRSSEVLIVERAPKERTLDEHPISFHESDAEGVQQPHDDPLVVTLLIKNYKTSRVLIDNGSSADILFANAFSQMGILKDKLQLVRSPLVGLSGEKVQPLGAIDLPISMGVSPCQIVKLIWFLVVNCPSAYNAILGRTTLNSMRAVTSTYHLLVKFPTRNGIGEQRRDQIAVRECYVATLKEKRPKEALVIEALDVRDEKEKQRAEPVEELVDVQIEEGDQGRVIKVRSMLQEDLKTQLVNFLKSNRDVFAWSHDHLTGIDPKIMSHHLGIDPKQRPVKQRTRAFKKERGDAVLEEVQKLIAANFVREMQYPDWLANVVLVRKANGDYVWISKI